MKEKKRSTLVIQSMSLCLETAVYVLSVVTNFPATIAGLMQLAMPMFQPQRTDFPLTP